MIQSKCRCFKESTFSESVIISTLLESKVFQAGLYILEQYFVKYIGDRDNVEDVPNDISKLFEMVNYTTKDIVVGKDNYLITADDIDRMLNNA